MFKRIKEFKWGYILLSFMLVLSGLSFFIFKDAEADDPIKRIAVAIGVILLCYAVLLAVITLAARGRGVKFAFNMVISVATLIAGLSTIVNPEGAEIWIIAVFGLVMVMDGSFKLQTSILSKRYKMWLWWVMLVLAVSTVAGGFICIKEFGLSVVDLSVVLGITLIVDGVSNFLSAFYISSYEKRMKREYLADGREDKPTGEENVQNS